VDCISVVGEYDEQKPIGKIIKEFKYHGALDVQKIWNSIFKKWLEKNNHLFLQHNFSLIPIPLHPRRKRERGFNQAALLAACLKNQFSQFEYIEQNLVRTRYTKQQAKLSREERIKNTQEAFSWTGGMVPEYVLLVDDVFTTGSTMQECAKVLKQAGSKMVYGFVIGRG
jgi:ComF family protein